MTVSKVSKGFVSISLGPMVVQCNNQRPKNPSVFYCAQLESFFCLSRPWWVERWDTWPFSQFFGVWKAWSFRRCDECCGCLHEQYWKSLGHGRPDVLLLENHGEFVISKLKPGQFGKTQTLSILKQMPLCCTSTLPWKLTANTPLKIVGRSTFPRFFPAYFQGTLEHGDVRTKFVPGKTHPFHVQKILERLGSEADFSRSAIRDPRRGKWKDHPIARGPNGLDSCWVLRTLWRPRCPKWEMETNGENPKIVCLRCPGCFFVVGPFKTSIARWLNAKLSKKSEESQLVSLKKNRWKLCRA